MAIMARTAMIAAAIINSINVKPVRRRLIGPPHEV
jgi:hypothetical protein